MADLINQGNQSRSIQPIEESAVYSKRDAGKITGTSESTIHRAIKARRLRAAFVGRRVVIRGAELLRWLQACEGGELLSTDQGLAQTTDDELRAVACDGDAEPSQATAS